MPACNFTTAQKSPILFLGVGLKLERVSVSVSAARLDCQLQLILSIFILENSQNR